MALQLITLNEMTTDLSERTGWSKSDVRSFLNHLEDFTVEMISDGFRVKYPAGVVVGPAVRPAQKKRKGRNPATGEEIVIPAKPASAKIRARIVKPLSDAKLPSVKRLKSLGA
jgi:nucleoid DNA-binding protein